MLLRARVSPLSDLRLLPSPALVQEPEQWSSYRSYAFNEEGMVKVNQWPVAELTRHPAA